MTQSIEIISWNVNGIRAVAKKGAFDWLEERQPHILCLQEIKALPEQMPDSLFSNRFLDYCQTLRNKGKKIIICGDVNIAHRPIDLKNSKSNEKTSGFFPIERAGIDKMLDHGYIDTFRHIHGDQENEYSW